MLDQGDPLGLKPSSCRMKISRDFLEWGTSPKADKVQNAR